ncbi:hypothetical protein N0V90_011584 [Kalmusia sp. IMI 367209]|nr:hypothetical protein N0V90_011584 [Kalmusia sp. IMI 367209]
MVAHRRGPWSQHEDRYLIELVTRNGPHNWVRISQEITTRSPKQCRERYHQNLKPTLNHDPISPEEGEMIEKLVAEMGKRWAEIARRLKGRSDNAVKNWWNGGQNRRKRNPERDPPSHSPLHHPQAGYHYPSVAHSALHEDDAAYHTARHSYPSSRRPSLNPPIHSPHAIKLPQPQGFEPYPGSRPAPLQLQSYPPHSARGRGVETPMPSPSGYSIVSADGFATEDDDHSAFDPRRRGSYQLPPLVKADNRSATPFREPTFKHENKAERPQLLTQPAHQLVHHHSLPYSAPLPEQRALPSFATLAEPGRVPLPSPSAASPSRQLPLPFARPTQPTETRSAPVSPKDKPQDRRMDLKNLL